MLRRVALVALGVGLALTLVGGLAHLEGRRAMDACLADVIGFARWAAAQGDEGFPAYMVPSCAPASSLLSLAAGVGVAGLATTTAAGGVLLFARDKALHRPRAGGA